ncbi:hypothetical protein M406DRAFT_343826 [Cryphonectria parasitica EP155]|uniref:Xaa-Pro aminopeptidase n=1 Tax=Cryphonectria parasitica (strain ATCC 38755 / EP155) TaxID=660469 RepID=A0A9P4YAZ7_CRYP1|nr:uncharacterized protein M406DRAFT_343826 [Cryphonectria parasitica EP155]KAF3769718.1 hypothetical protein M406DRAFT_343826 [Cryphonectria parasitica EP155]
MAPYEEVLRGKYPGKQHARKVVEYLRSKIPDATGVIYVESKKAKLHEDCDQEEHFRQRRSFYYLTGCNLPDCHYTYDISTDKATLYIPPIDPESVIWSGLPLSQQEALDQYDVDGVSYTTDVNGSLAHLAASSKTVFAVSGQVSDNITFLEFDDKNMTILKEAIQYSRAIKTPYEVALIQKANDISSVGHKAVMQGVKHAANESELHSIFLSNCTSKNAKNMAYDVIAASGRAAATLHYVRNDQPLAGKQNVLLDAGCELNCYASDITRTFPISGKFTPESRAIYDIVLRMQNESINMLKEGVRWDDVHETAHRIAIDGLLELGVLKGDKDEIFKSRTSVAFFPHGLGHYLGMDTHDTGGDPNYADKDAMFRYLRKRGTLPAGAVITVEPGIYFCKFIIEPALQDPIASRYIDVDVLEKYWDVGGVRIEDNVLITSSGCENLTSVLKDADEIEKLISSS